MPIATGFDFQPLDDGNLLIEFFGDDGRTVHKQVVTPEVVQNLPIVVALVNVALKKGPEAVKDIMDRLNNR
jgi:hypothetical protein